jgi:hypothetical protein
MVMTCSSMVVLAGNCAPVERVDGEVAIDAYRVVISGDPVDAGDADRLLTQLAPTLAPATTRDEPPGRCGEPGSGIVPGRPASTATTGASSLTESAAPCPPPPSRLSPAAVVGSSWPSSWSPTWAFRKRTSCGTHTPTETTSELNSRATVP